MASAVALARPALGILNMIWQERRVLTAVTRVEIDKKYSGSVFGRIWLLLHPILLLSIYLFVYMVVFKMKFPDLGEFDYVLFVFTGLVPYIGFSEAVTSGCTVIKSNLHLVKNVILPIEFIPVRSVLVSTVAQLASLGVLLLLLGIGGRITPAIGLVPIVLALQVMFIVGLVMILASIAVVVPDIGYFTNLLVLFLMFVSPIAFKPEMVPPAARFVVALNPLSYMIEAFRWPLFHGTWPPPSVAVPYVLLCTLTFTFGCWFFRRVKDVLVDLE